MFQANVPVKVVHNHQFRNDKTSKWSKIFLMFDLCFRFYFHFYTPHPVPVSGKPPWRSGTETTTRRC